MLIDANFTICKCNTNITLNNSTGYGEFSNYNCNFYINAGLSSGWLQISAF